MKEEPMKFSNGSDAYLEKQIEKTLSIIERTIAIVETNESLWLVMKYCTVRNASQVRVFVNKLREKWRKGLKLPEEGEGCHCKGNTLKIVWW